MDGDIDNYLVTSNVENSIYFCLSDNENPVLELAKGFFWYRGKKIEDIKMVYERFNDWLSKVTAE